VRNSKGAWGRGQGYASLEDSAGFYPLKRHFQHS